jgi:hypothetical protein
MSGVNTESEYTTAVAPGGDSPNLLQVRPLVGAVVPMACVIPVETLGTANGAPLVSGCVYLAPFESDVCFEVPARALRHCALLWKTLLLDSLAPDATEHEIDAVIVEVTRGDRRIIALEAQQADARSVQALTTYLTFHEQVAPSELHYPLPSAGDLREHYTVPWDYDFLTTMSPLAPVQTSELPRPAPTTTTTSEGTSSLWSSAAGLLQPVDPMAVMQLGLLADFFGCTSLKAATAAYVAFFIRSLVNVTYDPIGITTRWRRLPSSLDPVPSDPEELRQVLEEAVNRPRGTTSAERPGAPVLHGDNGVSKGVEGEVDWDRVRNSSAWLRDQCDGLDFRALQRSGNAAQAALAQSNGARR